MSMNIIQGEPCGDRVEINGKRYKCKWHFGLGCFTSVAHMKRLVQPEPRDGRKQQDRFLPGDVGYSVLRYTLDGSPARGEYPAEDPIHFNRELRIYALTGTQHYGWLPVWENGLTWPYWSYQHGFGGDYYGRVVRSAMRCEIYDQIEDARHGMGDAMHVHHVEPYTFAVLASSWLGRKGLFPKDISLYEPHPSFKLFADRDLGFEWQEFHAEHATLQVLTPEEHRAIHSAKVDLK